ncbi:MAG: PLDc N-terminal domain-containing protein, partial [Muribaculaceae bacterium]
MSQALYIILMIAYLITVIGIIVVVVSENRNPLKSLAWVTVLLFLPLVGIVLYIFFGRNLKSRQLISRRNKRKLLNKEDFKQIDINSLPLSDESKQEIKLAKSLTGAIYFPGNQIDIFTDGESKFKALLNDIDRS